MAAVSMGTFTVIFVVAAIGSTVLDLYLAGHGFRTLSSRELLHVPHAGIHMSVADTIAMSVAFLGAIAAVIGGRAPGR